MDIPPLYMLYNQSPTGNKFPINHWLRNSLTPMTHGEKVAAPCGQATLLELVEDDQERAITSKEAYVANDRPAEAIATVRRGELFD